MISNYKLYGLYLVTSNELSLDNLLQWMWDNLLAVVIAVCFIIWLIVIKRMSTTNSASKTVEVIPNDSRDNDSQDYINDTELVAVITAAIMAAMGDEAPPDGFHVRSIKKVNRRRHSNNYSI